MAEMKTVLGTKEKDLRFLYGKQSFGHLFIQSLNWTGSSLVTPCPIFVNWQSPKYKYTGNLTYTSIHNGI